MFKQAIRRAALWTLAVLLLFLAIQQFPDKNQTAATAYHAGQYTKAAKLWRKLARSGDSDAQYNLGAMYVSGRGVDPSDDDAAHWFLQAAENGNPAAQFEVGNLYEFGRGVPIALPLALSWIEKSAQQGFTPAQMDLGLKYLSGTVVQQDAERATFWLSRVVGESRVPPVLINGAHDSPFAPPCNDEQI
jgi:TPR repeat protein